MGKIHRYVGDIEKNIHILVFGRKLQMGVMLISNVNVFLKPATIVTLATLVEIVG